MCYLKFIFICYTHNANIAKAIYLSLDFLKLIDSIMQNKVFYILLCTYTNIHETKPRIL